MNCFKSDLGVLVLFTSVALSAGTQIAHADESTMKSHMLTVTSTSFPDTAYMDAIVSDGIAAGIRYVHGKIIETYTLEQLRAGATLVTDKGQKVAQIKIGADFDPRQGGNAEMIMLKEYNAFSTNDYRVLQMRVSNNNGTWTLYLDQNAGLEEFNLLHFVGAKWGIDSITLKDNGQTDASFNLSDLPQTN